MPFSHQNRMKGPLKGACRLLPDHYNYGWGISADCGWGISAVGAGSVLTVGGASVLWVRDQC